MSSADSSAPWLELAAEAPLPLLGRSLALKGGTALNLPADVPPQLSVDLDFNFVGALDRDEMLRQQPEVEVSVEREPPHGRHGVSRGAFPRHRASNRGKMSAKLPCFSLRLPPSRLPAAHASLHHRPARRSPLLDG